MRTLAYRGQLFVYTLATLFAVVPAVAVWFGMTGNGAGGYLRIDLISYYVVGLFIQRLVYSSLINYYVHEVTSDGSIVGLFLTKPTSFYWATYAMGLGWLAIAAVVGVIMTILFSTIIGVGITAHLTFTSTILTILAILLATILVFCSSLILGLLALWTTHISSFVSLYWIGLLLFGGITFPLTFFPNNVQKILFFNPYRFMFSFPLEILFSKINFPEILFGFGLCIFWILLFSYLYKIMWKRGVKAYSGYGQ